ncbi:MAG: hypothetical protein ACOX2P_03715 [Bacillota bacterium]
MPLILLIIVQPFFLILLNTSNYLAKDYLLQTIAGHNVAIGVLSVILAFTALVFAKQRY